MRNFIEKEDIKIDELLAYIEQVKSDGNVVVLKFDGERTENAYTAFISFPVVRNKEMIRVDGETLQSTLISLLNKYMGIRDNV